MISQVLWSLIVRGLLIAAAFLSSIVTARILGPEGRGVFFYWTTLAALVIQFGNLGLHSSNTYYLAKGQVRLSTVAANSFWVSIIGGAALGGLLTGVLWLKGPTLHEKWPFLLPTLLMIPAGLYFMLGINLFIAMGRIGEYNTFELINRYLMLAFVILAAWRWRTPAAMLTVTSIAAATVCLFLYRRIRALDAGQGPSIKVFIDGLSYAMRAYIAAALGFLVLRLNAFMLDRYADTATLGTWSVAAQLLDVIILVPSTIALVLLPRIMRDKNPYGLMHSQLRMVTILLLLLCMLGAWLGHDLISLAYGERFAGAYAMMLWGLPGALALGLISIHSQYLAAAGIPVALIWIWLGGLVVEAAMAVWLIPAYGGVGAMAAQSATYMIILASVWSLANHSNHAKKVHSHAN